MPRRRKIKCDGQRPVCDRCRRNPVKLTSPCKFDGAQNGLGDLVDFDDDHGNLRSSSPSVDLPNEPEDLPTDIQAILKETSTSDIRPRLVDIFFARFAHTPYFFLDPALMTVYPGSVRLPALQNAIHLVGSVLDNLPPDDPHLAHSLRECVVQMTTTTAGGASFPDDANLTLELLQTRVLLSLYYLYVASPHEGRYHAAAAVALAWSVQQAHPATLMAHEWRNAFLAVVILRTHWRVAYGLGYGEHGNADVTTLWMERVIDIHSGSQPSPAQYLSRACIFFERVSSPFTDSQAFFSLDNKLDSFHQSLPPLCGELADRTLILTHALTDLAIVRLHAPYTRTAEAAREKSLTAARRIVAGLAHVDLLNGLVGADILLGPIYASVATFYIADIPFHQICSGAQSKATLLTTNRKMCFDDMRHAYSKVPVKESRP
ncbi:hypothetical protein FB45DRAFT_1034394 [Roridomyces roridus]|uniref:Zn(2)-C6 fungal-type domain-containing protein n=1 Tax=Roridomyces roridus TaxID=1738132 RepID=A0AAD7BCP6_9AGAR|nr:hypothetical protein FB45DRAFT_1034394 [Roridomyces roridus]